MVKTLKRVMTRHAHIIRAKAKFSEVEYIMNVPGQSYLDNWRTISEAGDTYPVPEAQ